MRLRQYQQQAVDELREAFSRARRCLFVLPTGGGKTVIFTHIAKSAAAKGKRVLVLVHRRQLVKQTCDNLKRQGILFNSISIGKKKTKEALIEVGSIQTAARRLQIWDPNRYDLLVIDEAHHAVAAQWASVIDHLSKAAVLGVTATPCRMDGRGLGQKFEVMVKGPSPEWLTDNGFLADARVFAPPVGFDASKCRTMAGDFRLDDAEEQVRTTTVMGDVIAHYKRLLPGQTAIAFCCSIAHAEALAAEFRQAGVNAASIDGTMKDDRRTELLESLGRGELKVLTSCDLIGEGIDVPSVGGCILLRPTKSVALFLQMVGRCLRPSSGKVAVVLDHVGLYARHGHHLDQREWSLEEGVRKREGRETGPALWVCPSCYATAESSHRICPECGCDKPMQVLKQETVEGKLEEVRRQRQIALFEERQAVRDRKREQAQCRSYDELVALGRRRGMTRPDKWAFHIWKARKRRRA